jgi:hypothetical protein
MRGPRRDSELVETPPHRAEILFSLVPCCPLPARGARKVVPLGNRRKYQTHYRAIVGNRPQRTIHGQRHTSQACSPSRTEKKITCARPMRFSNGT